MSKKKTAPAYYLKRSDGTPSLSVTLVLVSFWVTTIVYILSAFENILHLQLKPFDPSAVAVYMGPILAHYWARRNTEQNAKNLPSNQNPINSDDNDDEDQSE